MAAANKTVWGIHTMDDPLFLNQNLIAIGWEEMGDLSAISTSRDAYKEISCRKSYKNVNKL